MAFKTTLKILAIGIVALTSTAATSTSHLNYRIHYLTENGNSEPGFPYPYVGYSEYYCDSTVVTYGKLTSNEEYEFVSNC